MIRESSERTVTQKDVAELAGVSRALVSYVINSGPREVAPETRQRVLDAIHKLGYQPNKHAQRLKLGSDQSKQSLGIIAGGESFNVLERPYYDAILAGLFEEAHRLGQEVRFFSFFEALTDPVFFNNNIQADEISGLILILPALIAATQDYGALLDRIAERIANVVCLEEQIRNWPTVVFDRAAAARLAVEHLVALGHQRIGYLAIEDERLTGYRQTLLEHHLAYDQQLVFPTDHAHVFESTYQATLQLIEMRPRPTAIFAANDERAISAIAALHDHALRVPQDMAIVSIDNISIAKMIRPGLTTVDVPKKRMAAYALQVLMMQKQFQNRQAASVVVPVQLIVRDSCGGRTSGDSLP
jgi:DNA-binding LacI/PurR family transcriptional regulator